MPVKMWSKNTIRCIAVGNLVMCAVGLLLQLDLMIRIDSRPKFSVRSPYEMYVFWAMACISMIFGIVGVISVPLLWRLDNRGRRLCNWLFGAELIYWVATSQTTILLAISKSEWIHSLGTGVATARVVGGLAISPQFITLYPIWALVLLNVGYQAINKSTTRGGAP